MNWKNINLKSSYERSQNILDSFDSNTLLLECECNLKVINKETIKAQALLSLKMKYDTAIEILLDNLDNLTNEALTQRAVK